MQRQGKRAVGVKNPHPIDFYAISRAFLTSRSRHRDRLVRNAGYPGFIPDPSVPKDAAPAFFVSWYSQHDTDSAENRHAANVYVARVVIE
ncbi:MAG: hypothetical protein AMXMBFR4_13610 [Candidatus Hydrogenedentota bacterium]